MKVPFTTPAEEKRGEISLYLLLETGLLTNEKIGQLFVFSYSSVSHIVKSVRARAKKDRKFSEKPNFFFLGSDHAKCLK